MYQAEISAISATVRELLSRSLQDQIIEISVDNQASLRALNNPVTWTNSVREAKAELNALGQNNEITLHWIAGHKGYKGNEMADKLANDGVGSQIQGPIPLPSKKSLFSEIESMTMSDWELKWDREPGCRQSKFFLMSPSKRNAKYLFENPRDTIGQAVRYLTGHAFLRRHNAIVENGISPPPGDVSCRMCEDPDMDETPHHLITECEALCGWRSQTMGSFLLNEYPTWDIQSLIKFIRHKDLILLETD